MACFIFMITTNYLNYLIINSYYLHQEFYLMIINDYLKQYKNSHSLQFKCQLISLLLTIPQGSYHWQLSNLIITLWKTENLSEWVFFLNKTATKVLRVKEESSQWSVLNVGPSTITSQYLISTGVLGGRSCSLLLRTQLGCA